MQGGNAKTQYEAFLFLACILKLPPIITKAII